MIGLISVVGFYAHTVSQAALEELADINVAQANSVNRMQINVAEGQANLIRFGEYERRGMSE